MLISCSHELLKKSPEYEVVKLREEDLDGDGSNSSYYYVPIIWVV